MKTQPTIEQVQGMVKLLWPNGTEYTWVLFKNNTRGHVGNNPVYFVVSRDGQLFTTWAGEWHVLLELLDINTLRPRNDSWFPAFIEKDDMNTGWFKTNFVCLYRYLESLNFVLPLDTIRR